MSEYTPPAFCLFCGDPESICQCDPNQCDGCRAGMWLDETLHRDHNGRAVMVCQRSRYYAAHSGVKDV